MNKDDFIQYTNVKQGEEFQRLHPKCQEVAQVASLLAKVIFGKNLICTSIYRKKTTDTGIHEAFRAIDFAPLPDIKHTYFLIRWINSIYRYDPDRPQLNVAHENPFHGTAAHIHIQVHDHTTVLPKSVEVLLMAQASQDQAAFVPTKLG